MSWRLAPIVDDVCAIKVAAAYYSLSPDRRNDLDALADASGIPDDIVSILARLETAGVLGWEQPPAELVTLINAYCLSAVKKVKR